MHHFCLWAPNAQRISVTVDGAVYPMRRDERFYWHADVDAAHPGSRYGFLVDDDPHPYPDPRSHFQPDGVHRLSMIVDHASYQ